jgi:hypothetical protein
LTNLLKATLSFNPYCCSALHITWTLTFGEFMYIIPHNLLSDELVWAHPCYLTPPQEKNGWFKWSHTTRSSIRSRWCLPVDLCQGWSLVRFIFIIYFVSLPLCNKYSNYIVTFISIHSVIIYVVFFSACMRCTRLCPLKPGCDRSGIRGMLTVGQNLDRNGQILTNLPYSDSFLNLS